MIKSALPRWSLLSWLAVLLLPSLAWANPPPYDLHAKQVADNTYVFLGKTAFFAPDNGGNIVNTGFIVTRDGVVVIDSGPSLRYGQEMRAAIAAVTPLPVVKVIITHMHPDHFLGSGGFLPSPILATPETIGMIEKQGVALAGNLYTLIGDAMRGTEPVVPQPLPSDQEDIGGHHLRYLRLGGHTVSDLVVFDETTGVVFSGDLVFFQRTPTIPHAELPRWLESLTTLRHLPYRVMIPGHGPIVRSDVAIAQTADYLQWLDQTFRAAVAGGLDITEVYRLPKPARFRSLAILDEEYERSVGQRYPQLEGAALPSLAATHQR